MARDETYEEFVAKFRPKKTTDDCYTPPAVYDAVMAWAMKEYRLEGREVVRPFFPGGDFEHYDYPPNCVVIDNPPFSIFAHILDVYRARGIDYFLFAPSLTATHYVTRGNVIITDTDIVYDNGAKVVTAFVSNMGDWALRTAPDLRVAILAANRRSSRGDKVPIYEYPPQIVTAARLQKLAAVDFRVRRSECEFVRALDAQRRGKKNNIWRRIIALGGKGGGGKGGGGKGGGGKGKGGAYNNVGIICPGTCHYCDAGRNHRAGWTRFPGREGVIGWIFKR